MRPPIDTLMNGGDWACAHADPRSLVDVCHELAAVVAVELVPELHEIAHVAHADMERASWAWLELSQKLRRLPIGADTRPGSPDAPSA